MLLTSLEFHGFRNLEGGIEFGSGLNILWGRNAAGKTSILEAIYGLANTKSFRASALRDAIRFGADEAIVRGVVLRGNITRELQMRLTGTRKEFFVNSKRQSTVGYISHLDAIAFSFEEMGIVRGEPSERRRFLDRGIVGLTPAYLKTLAEYNHILKQKNRLLRDASEAGVASRPDALRRLRDQLEPWNSQLVDAGTRIHRARTRYVARLSAALAHNLFGEPVTVRYRSSFEGKGDLAEYEDLFLERLRLRFDAELAVGFALIGPHRDDLEVCVDGREVSRFGSAGQQRSALLILDLAQAEVYYEAYEEYPVLLIDDIDAELDRDRIDTLLVHLEGKAQTFVSTSKEAIARAYGDRAECFLVRAGRVAPIEEWPGDTADDEQKAVGESEETREAK
jgi:DNA replication and repair protein RecF